MIDDATRRLTPCTDPAILDAWHVVGVAAALADNDGFETHLLEAIVRVSRDDRGRPTAHTGDGTRLPLIERFGYVWVSLGTPATDLFDIPECAEPDRRNLHAATMGVHVSAPRAIENFLDLGHFPFVHTGYLGIEPYTQVKPYDVRVSHADGILATHCRFFQPRSAAAATEGFEVEYVFRVPHPYAAYLYKANAEDRTRMDVIAIFVQPVDQERVLAHLFVSLLDTVTSDTDIRRFQQMIFAQDKPILENQRPKRLPLDLRSEVPIKGDATSIAYRRWLRDRGVTYGTVG